MITFTYLTCVKTRQFLGHALQLALPTTSGDDSFPHAMEATSKGLTDAGCGTDDEDCVDSGRHNVG